MNELHDQLFKGISSIFGKEVSGIGIFYWPFESMFLLSAVVLSVSFGIIAS